MKKYSLPLVLALLAVVCTVVSCNSDEETTWDEYREYRDLNNEWLADLQTLKDENGEPYYKMIVPSWNPGAFVLLHHYNDPAENADKLSPLYTSTIDVRYKLHLYDGTPVDSSDNVTQYGTPGVYRAKLNTLVQGWAIGLSGQVHCGDSVELIVPYGVGYGAQTMGEIKPYSNLRFNIRLVDIPYYELAPYE